MESVEEAEKILKDQNKNVITTKINEGQLFDDPNPKDEQEREMYAHVQREALKDDKNMHIGLLIFSLVMVAVIILIIVFFA